MKLKQLLVGAFLLVAGVVSAQMQMPPIPIDKNVKIGIGGICI